MNSLKLSKIFFFFIFLILVSGFGLSDTSVSYVIALSFITFFGVSLMIRSNLRVSFFWFDMVPAVYIFVWIYGVLLGFFLGNKPIYVVSNFAGMSIYLIYFMMVFTKFSAESLVRAVFLAAIVNALYSYSATAWVLMFDGRSYFDQLRMYYSPSLSVLAPFIASSLVAVSLRRESNCVSMSKNMALFLFLSIPYAILAFSKGYFASFAILMCLVVLMIIFSAVRSLKITRQGLLVLVSSLISITAIIYNFGDELQFALSVEEHSNSKRFEMAPMLIAEFNVFGNGLGAVLDSGYIRNNNAPYGFELTFLNIIHKFGFVGYLVWSAYAACIAIPLFNVFFRRANHYSWLAIGGMLFVVPGYGNPLLFSPVIVTLHCAVMYLIRESISKKEARRYV